MGKELFSIIIITFLFLNSLFITGFNFNLQAKDQKNEQILFESKGVHPLSDENFEWSEIEVISEPILNQNNNINESSYQKIAVEDDKIYVVWQDKTNISNNGDDSDIFYRHFDGISWSKIQVISEPVLDQNLNTRESMMPDIAVENGKIYVVWQDRNDTNNAGTDNDIFYICNLTGTKWEDVQVISEPVVDKFFNNGQSDYPAITVENGKIYVAWVDSNITNGAGFDDDIFFRDNLSGSNWEPVQVISEPVQGENFNTKRSWSPEIAVENGKIYIIWEDLNETYDAGWMDSDIFYRCNLTGSSWEYIQVISEPVPGQDFNIGSSDRPEIAVENGKIYVVWADQNNTNGAGIDYDIFYRSNLTGTFWEPVQVISEPISGQDSNINSSSGSSIAVEDGKIYVVWGDRNNTNGAGGDRDIFYRNNITGSNWEEVQVISEPISGSDLNTGNSFFPDIAINLGKNHVVWQDVNNTNNAGTDVDIFYRSISTILGLGSPSLSPTSGNTSTIFNFTIAYINRDNKPPTGITVNISGKEYSMLEVDPTDTNYMDSKYYFFNIKNLDVGLHTFKFWTSDGVISILTRLFNFPIVYNTPPNIITNDNSTAFEDVYYEVDYEYEDIDVINIDQAVFWNFSTNATWLDFNYTTTILNGSPTTDNLGNYWVNISIFDTIDIDFINFTLTVFNVNDPPVITNENIKITYEDEYYNVDYEAVDIDTTQNKLVWSLDTNASWLKFDASTSVLDGTPINDDVGEYWVNVSVEDNEYTDFSNFTLRVLNVNDPPKIITKDNITAIEDEFYEVVYKTEDVDNTPNELSWTITSNAKWLAMDTMNAIINGTPENDDVGEYWVNISVSDIEYIDFTNFTLTVINTNDPPRITPEDKTNVTVGELYLVNYEAEDIDPVPTTLTWSLKTNASNWLTIDKITGWLNGVPIKDDAGIYWVNVSVTDGESGWDHHNFTLQVIKLPTKENTPPELSNASMAPSEGDIKTEFTFSVHYYDKDSEASVYIQVIIDNRAYNMNLKAGENASNGTYEYSTFLPEGTHAYYFMASDGLEIVKTDNSTSPEIKKVEKISQEKTSWYLLVGIGIIVVIFALVIFMFVYKKYKVAKIPTVRAELLFAPPDHVASAGITAGDGNINQIAPQPIVSKQLPTQTGQVQPTSATPSEKVSVPTLAPIPVSTQFQLPKDTLTTSQRLGLLQERFLRGEITEETYKELKAEIETHTGEEITKDELEEQPTISVQQQSETIEEQTKLEAIPNIVTKSEPIDKSPQQVPIEPQNVLQQPQQLHETTEAQPKLQPQTLQQQPTTQIQQQKKPMEKDNSQQQQTTQ